MTTPDIVNAEAGRAIVWRVHPAGERPVSLAAALAVISVFAWLAAEWMESWMWGLFAAVLMMAFLGRFFLPSEYQVDGEGVTARHGLTHRRLRWNEIRRFVHDARGAYLSTRSRPTALDGVRGVHLLFSGNAQVVVDHVRNRLADQSRAAGDRPAGEIDGEGGTA